MSSGKLTTAESLAWLGRSVPVDAHLQMPTMNPQNSTVDYMTLFKRLAYRASHIPEVDDTLFTPPIVFFDDFISAGMAFDRALLNETDPGGAKFSSTADVGQWLVTNVGAIAANNVITVADTGAGGILQITTAATGAGDLIGCQINGESFALHPGYPLFFEASWGVADVTGAGTSSEVFIGLADTSADTYNGNIGDADHVGFMLHANTGDIIFSMDEGAAALVQQDTGANLVAATPATWATANTHHRTAFYWDGGLNTADQPGTVHVYVDGVEVCLLAGVPQVYEDGVHTYGLLANVVTIPDGIDMTPSFQIETDGANAAVMYIDYIMVAKRRGTT